MGCLRRQTTAILTAQSLIVRTHYATEVLYGEKGSVNKKVVCGYRVQFTVAFVQNLAKNLFLLWERPRGRGW
jgi:hypothetical protein